VKARIVVETKNSKLSKKEWLKEIEDGKANRDASGFIGFCKNINDMPNKNRVMIFDRQTILVAYDPETEDPQIALIIYQLVKMNTLATAGHLDDTRISEINDRVDQAIASLKKFDSLTKDARSVEKLGKQMVSSATLLKAEIANNLEAIQASISLDLEPIALEPQQSLELTSWEEDGFVDDEELGINLDRPDQVA
jgi:hypothetical protein